MIPLVLIVFLLTTILILTNQTQHGPLEDEPHFTPAVITHYIQDYGNRQYKERWSALHISGSFGHGSHDAFLSALKKYRPLMVSFDSHGGYSIEGMKIGEEIRSRNLDTVIWKKHSCQSACVYSFVGGARRYAYENGALGVHQARMDFSNMPAEEISYKMQSSTALEFAYFAHMGISDDVPLRASSTPANEMYLFSVDEMRSYRLVTK